MKGHLTRAQVMAPHQITLGTQLVDHQILKAGQYTLVVSDAWTLLTASINRIKRIYNLGVAIGSFDLKRLN